MCDRDILLYLLIVEAIEEEDILLQTIDAWW